MKARIAALRAEADAYEAFARAKRAEADELEAAPPPASAASVVEPLIDKRELARRLGVSPATIDRLDREGQPFLRVGDVKRYACAEVLRWHAERTLPDAPPVTQVTPKPSGVRRLSRVNGGAR